MPGFGPIGDAPIGGLPEGEAAEVTIRRGVSYGFGPYASAPYASIQSVSAAGPTPVAGSLSYSRFLVSKQPPPSTFSGRTYRAPLFHYLLPIPLGHNRHINLRSKPPHPSWIDAKHQRYPRQFHYTPPDTAGTPVNKFRRFLKTQPLHPSLYEGAQTRRLGYYFPPLPPKINYHRVMLSKPLHPSMYNGNVNRENAVLIIHYESIESDITFGSTIDRDMEYSRSFEDTFNFGQYVETNIKYFEIESTVTFDADISRNVEYSRDVETNTYFEQRAQRTIEATVTSLVTFAAEIAKGGDVESLITFGQAIVADTSKGVENEIIFDVDIAPNVEYGRSIGSTITFGVNVQGYVVSGCNLSKYLPIGDALESVTQGDRSTVIFSRGGDSIELRNPEFGNTEAHDIRRVLRETRGGTTRIGQRSIWAKEVRLNLTFRALTEVKAQELLTFIKDNIGQEIDYLDQENQDWTGVITSVTDPIVDVRGDNCFYAITVEYVANRQ